jgi:hypothetical protein
MKRMTTNFFEELYTVDPHVEPETILINVVPQISQDINEKLCMEFSEDEIGNALSKLER